MVQIYKSTILDLLNSDSIARLITKTDFSTGAVFIQNIHKIEVNSVKEAFSVLTEGQKNHILCSNAIKADIASTHMLIIFNVVQRNVNGNELKSRLIFGDLGGSEAINTLKMQLNLLKERKTVNKYQLDESIAINTGLSAFSNVIKCLAKVMICDTNVFMHVHVLFVFYRKVIVDHCIAVHH